MSFAVLSTKNPYDKDILMTDTPPPTDTETKDPAVLAKIGSIYTAGVEMLQQQRINLFGGFQRNDMLDQFGAFLTFTPTTLRTLEDRLFSPLRQLLKELGFTSYAALDQFEPHVTAFTAKGDNASFEKFLANRKLQGMKASTVGQQVTLSRLLPDKANILLASTYIPESVSALRGNMSKACSDAGLTVSIPENLLHMTILRIKSAQPTQFAEYLARFKQEVEAPILTEPIIAEFGDCRICSVPDLLGLP